MIFYCRADISPVRQGNVPYLWRHNAGGNLVASARTEYFCRTEYVRRVLGEGMNTGGVDFFILGIHHNMLWCNAFSTLGAQADLDLSRNRLKTNIFMHYRNWIPVVIK